MAAHLESAARLTAFAANDDFPRPAGPRGGPKRFAMREPDARGEAENLVFRQIVSARKPYRGARGLVRGKSGAAQRCANARHQLVRAERPRYEIVSAAVEHFDFIPVRIAQRDDDDRSIP